MLNRRAALRPDGARIVHCLGESSGQNWANRLPMNALRDPMGHADMSPTGEFYCTISEDHLAKARWIMEAGTDGNEAASDAELTATLRATPLHKAGW